MEELNNSFKDILNEAFTEETSNQFLLSISISLMIFAFQFVVYLLLRLGEYAIDLWKKKKIYLLP